MGGSPCSRRYCVGWVIHCLRPESVAQWGVEEAVSLMPKTLLDIADRLGGTGVRRTKWAEWWYLMSGAYRGGISIWGGGAEV